MINSLEIFSLLDLIHPDARSALEISGAFHLPNSRQIIQQSLSTESKLMIDAIHMFYCKSDSCAYHTEESLEDTWILPMHILLTDVTLDLMNKCNFTVGEFGKLIDKYLRVLKIMTPTSLAEPSLTEFLRHMHYSGTTYFLQELPHPSELD